MQGIIHSLQILERAREGRPHHPSKDTVPLVTVERNGFKGDYHNRAMRPSYRKPGTFKPNTDRHVSLLALEVIEEMNKALRLAMRPGTLGENITTREMGDLSKLKAEDRLLIIGSATHSPLCVLRVVEQNEPCINLGLIHPKLAQSIFGRRGVLCAVEFGEGRILSSGDFIQVISPV